MARKIGLLMLSFVFAIVLVACSNSDDKNEGENEKNDGNEEVEKENDKVEDKEDESENEEAGETDEANAGSTDALAVGEKADLAGLEIELTEVEKYEGSDFNIPDNDHYMILTLSIENNREEDVQISSLASIKLLNSEGEEYSVALLAGEDIELVDGTLEPGKSIVGQVPYDVKNADNYQLIYEDILGNETAEWTIPAEAVK